MTFVLLSTGLHASMEYFKGEASEQLLQEKDTTVTLMTWNILGLPNDEVAVRPWEERIDGIVKKILVQNPDVVLLEESFVPELSQALYSKLQGTYAHTYLHLTSDKQRPSGLALFSKLPVEKFAFHPHRDLLDGDAKSEMGTLDFYLLNKAGERIAHIAGSHFLGSSNCEWRKGKVDGEILSYAEIREREAQQGLLFLQEDSTVPAYMVGDLNVDTRFSEFLTSSLNTAYNPQIRDPMPCDMRLQGTNTSFWKHERGIESLFPTISREESIRLAIAYKEFYERHLKPELQKGLWTEPLADFKEAYLQVLKAQLGNVIPEQKIWDYFVFAVKKAITQELKLWKDNGNQGAGPNVSIGRAIEIRALPIDEALDFVVGTNALAHVEKIEILEGYQDRSEENTLSDHHPIYATLRVGHHADSSSN